MTRFLVSTVRRHSPAHEPSGYYYVVDLEAGRVLQRSFMLEPPFLALDTNPRGGMRGAKGISVREDQIALANYSIILRYDPQWKLLGTITHPSCAGIHDILFDGDSLWVTGSISDVLFQFDLQGNMQRFNYLREASPALEALKWKPARLLSADSIRDGRLEFRHPLRIEKETYDRGHLNGICRLSCGDLLVSLGFVYDDRFANWLRLKIKLIHWGIWPALRGVNRLLRKALGSAQSNMDQGLVVRPSRARSAIFRISSDGRHSLVQTVEDVSAPSHSLLALPDDTVAYLNTTNGSLLHLDPANGQITVTHITADGFLRGAAQIDDTHLLVGSRDELIVYELVQRQVHSRVRISEDPSEAIYDIKALPDHYALPPPSFAEDFKRQTGLGDPVELFL